MADLSIVAANFITSALADLVEGVAGETLTRGQTLYFDPASSTYKKFDADDVTKDAFIGFACEDVGLNQQVLVCRKDPALQLGVAIASGDTVWGSSTAGGCTKTATDLVSTMRVWSLGVGTATGVLNFYPVKGGIKP